MQCTSYDAAVLECVVNVSEGIDLDVLAALDRAAGGSLLDRHTDRDHNRSVYTLVGTRSARSLATSAVRHLDIGRHTGAHPRIGVVDVVPFVPLAGSTIDDAVTARDDFAGWIAGELGVPAFVYGAERTLPAIRRGAFTTLEPDYGPMEPHPTAGAVAVGARPPLVAYNLWLGTSDLGAARSIASAVRSDEVRALGLAVGTEVQVSMNLVSPDVVGPAEVYDAVAAMAHVARAELVGLVPRSVLDHIDPQRWVQLDLAVDRTIEARIARTRDPQG